VIGSVVVHTAAIFLAWWTSAVSREVPEFIVYQIELISPSAAELGEPTPTPPEELVIETPLDRVPEPQEETPALVEEQVVEEEPPQPEETVAPPEVEPVEEPVPPASQDPDPDVETPGEDLNVRMEGIRRDYPEYYNNIIRQMQRCFRWRGDENLRATVYFVINRDGSVAEVDILESSRSIAFDIEAMGAAECAGSRDRLGPLPEELPYDRLPIRFEFDPLSGRSPNDGA
jgi:outer membrane biosynthesis protein TonB